MNAKSHLFILKNPSLKALYRGLLATTLCAALCYCSQKSIVFNDPCAAVDLYELGRQDGSTGRPAPDHAAVSELNACVPEKSGTNMKMYMAGRNAGLVEYCSFDNGLTVGRSDQSYFYVCPEFVEPQFLSGYHRGVKIRRLEEEKRTLTADIAELSATLEREPVDSPVADPLKARLEKLRVKQALLEKELSDSSQL